MPLILQKTFDPDIELGIWRIEEDIEFFKSNIELFEEEIAEVKDLNQKKLMEWYCSRHLLHILSGRESRGACLKDQYGKPYLNNSEYHISISHSFDLCTVIASKRKIGVDIQKKLFKIERIKEKFIREDELTAHEKNNRLEKLHIYWGAKESLYKIHGKRELNFKKHMKIDDFTYNSNGVTQINGTLKLNDSTQKYMGKSFGIEDFILCYLAE